MKKLFLTLTAVLLAGLLFTSANPSLDGRALVAKEGVFPRGYFAKTVGYLPGDSIKVTNPVNGETVDILVIGSLDASDGVAILLSPEAASALNIKKNSNNLVKLTKRTGTADEVANGSAVITMGAAEEDAPVVEEETPQIAEAPAEEEYSSAIDYSEDIVPEEVAEAPAEEATPVEEIAAAPVEETPEEAAPVEEEVAKAEDPIYEIEEVEPEEVAEVPVEEAEEIPEEVAEAPVEEAEEIPEEIAEAPVEEAEEVPEEIAEVPVEEVEEVAEAPEETEEIPEEIVMEGDEPQSEYVEADDIPEETEYEEYTELVEEELPDDYLCDGPESEYVEADDIPEDEELALLPEESEVEMEEIPEDTEEEISETEYVEAEEIPEESLAFAPEDLSAEDEEEEIAQGEEEEEETPEEIAQAEEETEELEDEYDAIVLVPSQDNPPEQKQEAASNLVESTTTIAAPEPKSEIASVTNDAQLVPQKYYVQIAVYNDAENVDQVNKKYGSRYPLVVLDKGNRKAVMVGPLSVDEYGIVLERFRAYGFKDAFVKKTN